MSTEVAEQGKIWRKDFNKVFMHSVKCVKEIEPNTPEWDLIWANIISLK